MNPSNQHRTAVFIDGAHFTRSMRKGYNRAPNVAYPELCGLVAPAGSTVVTAYYYDAMPYAGRDATARDRELASGKRRFFDALRGRKVNVREGRVAREWNAEASGLVDKQKFVDVLLATDLVWLAATREIESAVLITGDSDFIPAVERAKTARVHVRLVHTAWAHNVHRDLVRAASEVLVLDHAMLATVLLPRHPANDNDFAPWEEHPPRKGTW